MGGKEHPASPPAHRADAVAEVQDQKEPAQEYDPKRSWPARVRAELSRITLHFLPNWFVMTMGTGITAVLFHEMPYSAQWLCIISYIVFGLNVVLFLLFTVISIVRYVRWPSLLFLLLRHPVQSMFLGAFSMGFSTLINMCVLAIAPHTNYHFTLFVWALWWINSAMAVAMCISLPVLQFTRHTESIMNVSGAMFMPVVTTIVAAASGGKVASLLPPNHAKLTITICYIMWGSGFAMAISCMAMFYMRLVLHKVPQAGVLITVFMPVGICGQGSYALLVFSSVLRDLSLKTGQTLVGASEVSPDEARQMALAIYAITIPFCLAMWGFGLVWLFISLSLLADMWLVSPLPFNLGWWGITFPLGTFCTSTAQLANEYNSEAFRVIGTVLSVAEILIWFVLTIITFYRALRGDIFLAPGLEQFGGIPPTKAPMHRQYKYQPRAPKQSHVEEGNNTTTTDPPRQP